MKQQLLHIYLDACAALEAWEPTHVTTGYKVLLDLSQAAWRACLTYGFTHEELDEAYLADPRGKNRSR